MSDPIEQDGEPDWSELAPNLREQELAAAERARQVRLMLSRGRTHPEIIAWLQQNFLTADAARAFLAEVIDTQLREASPTWEVTSGPSDYGGVYAPREDAGQKRRDRAGRRERSKRLAEGEPDPAFDLGQESHAAVVIREGRRRGRETWFGWVLLAFVVLPLVLGLVAFVWALLRGG